MIKIISRKVYWEKGFTSRTYSRKDDGFVHLLAEGKIDGLWCKVFSLETHPVAYVGIPLELVKDKEINWKREINCHWGVTFCREGKKDYKRWNPGYLWIGWDYAHCDDYQTYPYDSSRRIYRHLSFESKLIKHSVESIIEEVKSVVKQIKKIINLET
jgi:hypothetical protein